MDLELTDEQTWLAESIETLLTRSWPALAAVAEASTEDSERAWRELVAFGALSIGGEDGLGAVELALIARALGSHLVSVPFLGSAAVRLALPALAAPLPGEPSIALAWIEPGASAPGPSARWPAPDGPDGPDGPEPQTSLVPGDGGVPLHGRRVAVEHAGPPDWLAVTASLDGVPALAAVPAGAPGLRIEPRASFDASLPLAEIGFDGVIVPRAHVVSAPDGLARLGTVGALLAAAEAIGAASAVLDLACRYAGERRQFGHTIASFQALRHILADLYVRQASGWSTVLYAAAAFDDATPDGDRLASVAKAYVSRAAREVAHGAMQVFGGIAFTAEHPAHRYLRRIVARERQFGDAAHHERVLGRALAQHAVRKPTATLAATR